MKHQGSITKAMPWPRVWGVDDPTLVDLSDEYTAIELFVDEPSSGFFHILRFMIETTAASGRVCSEGILVGRSDSADRPHLSEWSGASPDLTVLSCIDLGTETYALGCDALDPIKLAGKINDDPIVFLNFDPETTTARFMTSVNCVPVPAQERHLQYLQGHAAVA